MPGQARHDARVDAAALDKPTTASSSAPAITAWCSARISRNAGSTSCWSTAACNTAAGWSTEEVTAPGFYHNLHSINHFHITETPWFKDLNLGDRVTYITPRYEFGQPHLDGTALVFGRDLEETLANVARFSKKDAQTFRDWNRKAEEITATIFLPERYSEPLPQAEREALLAQERHRPRFPGGDAAAAVRRGEGAVRERARAAAVPVQGVAVRHLAGRHACRRPARWAR